jgi:2,4-dienoyl-CoA reductase-like NADH-dependent reductase (Old Yellow Enzyme family)
LTIVEHSYVSSEGRLSEKQLGIYDDGLILGLEKLSSSIHATGSPAVIQINHAGRRAKMEITHVRPVAPSATENARKLRTKEIEGLVEAYARAADRAVKAGFDGVEVHGAHGFLLNQFYSPLSNQRKDKYGGTLRNRIRFPLEVVERVKDKVKGKLLLYRIGSDDLDPKGPTIEDSCKFASKLQASGVDIIDVSGGLCGSEPAQLKNIQGYFIPQAERIRKAVNIPVIGVGGITEPEYADSIIKEGRVDLIAIGRQLLKNPDWASEAIKTLER